MADFVQGPWEVTEQTQNVCAVNSPENGGNIICQAPRGFIASLVYWEANARLIAAVPDLLEACKAFVDFAPSDGHRCLYCDARVYAVDSTDEHSPDCELIKGQAAIAKAEGKETKDV